VDIQAKFNPPVSPQIFTSPIPGASVPGSNEGSTAPAIQPIVAIIKKNAVNININPPPKETTFDNFLVFKVDTKVIIPKKNIAINGIIDL
jgi:hypothetical protein